MTASSDPAPRLYPLEGKRVWVAGHRGMVGAALMRRLAEIDCEVLTAPRTELDLRRQSDVERWVEARRPQAIFLAAARVGGIVANDSFPGAFLYDNLAIETNVIEAARRTGAEKLLFLGSSCIYPKFAPQPIPEDALLTGPLEPTNEWYAIAKIAGLKLCEAYRRQYGCDFISAMPTNLYGPEDNFDLQTSHVIPALLRKAHDARVAGRRDLEIWGSGAPRREFLYVDDCADALVFLMERYSDLAHVNVGSGSDVTIRELAEMVMQVAGLDGEIRFDRSKPDGTPRKLMAADRLAGLGWGPQTDLATGLKRAYAWYVENKAPAAADA